MAKLKTIDVGLKLPGLELSGTWTLDDIQRRAAWEMYVELVTRIALEPLRDDEGVLREALSSLHQIFGETRRILRAAGPEAAMAPPGALSFGMIAVDVLNRTIRPFLAKWHPRLQAHEAVRPAGLSPASHEAAWPERNALRKDLTKLQKTLAPYADLLAEACGVSALHRDTG